MNGITSFLTAYGELLFYCLAVYLSVISLVSAIVTIADKHFSKKTGHRRVPESTLLLYSAFGGSVAMLITMLLIRHKTRHVKFMLGIPLIILFQAIVAVWLSARFV
ncbi:MAG: DUF1294 domain-containing protein [Clostridia bacterium]|nr:DUF1294 domain-containing protein [Clostridia bacterium]